MSSSVLLRRCADAVVMKLGTRRMSIMSRYFDWAKRPTETRTETMTEVEEPDPSTATPSTGLELTSRDTEDQLEAPKDLGTETLTHVLEGKAGEEQPNKLGCWFGCDMWFLLFLLIGFVCTDLVKGSEVRDEVLHVVGESAEYADYEKEVDFEMNLLRLRYHNNDAPMTPARRSQMQAHLHQVQQALMKEHAEAAADSFVESLSKDEVDQLSKMFDTLESKGVPLQPPSDRESAFDTLASSFEAALDKVEAEAEAAASTSNDDAGVDDGTGESREGTSGRRRES